MPGGARVGHRGGGEFGLEMHRAQRSKAGFRHQADARAADVAGDQTAGVEAGGGLGLGHPRLGQLHLAAGQLPFGLGDFAQLERFGQPGLALDKLGRQGSGCLLLGFFEGVNPRHCQVQRRGEANREHETLAQPADQHVEIEVLRRRGESRRWPIFTQRISRRV